ncbi:MAG TPA: hypothetical protein VHA82_11800 [Ramlibacter sp.]|uniref:hypothetical protein n=1 Tax=Ramlibacter sp. TaxID=1917967 RepID=UPI002B98199E|nr:hypothetical protein [Ramlibacter sp.]HVZ44485.1 hypothetical protein [Ramlibacter sp.]
MKKRGWSLNVIALAAVLACSPASAQTAEAELAAQVRQLRAEMQKLRDEMEALKKQQGAATAPAPATGGWNAPAAASASGPGPAAAAAPQSADASTGLRLFGYGELSYSRPRKDPANTVATLGRGVLGFGYRFDERTRMAAELEVENAVASADDRGEVELEQMYIEHDFTPNISAKAGLFLMPIGLLNESHEPTRYFGVFRNQVETAIIPTTWREIGIGVQGTTDSGWRWNTGVVTGFNLTAWDPASTEGIESPLGAIHQEGQLALARTLAGYAAVNYSGVPGLKVGGSIFHGGAGQKQPGFAAPDATVTLAEAHARWQAGPWDIAALAAQGRFSGIAALNATFAGQPAPVPDRFGGWYAQGAYRVWQAGPQSLWPFARYERLNTASSYSGLPAGVIPAPLPATRTVTVGANYYLNPQVVFKVDYMRFVDDSTRDRFNLGVGFDF